MVKKNSVSNASNNVSAISVASCDQLEARSMYKNHQNIKDLFKRPINIIKTQNVSSNTTKWINKDIDSYFELFFKSPKGLHFQLRQQLGDNHCAKEQIFRKRFKSFCSCTVANSNPINAQ